MKVNKALAFKSVFLTRILDTQTVIVAEVVTRKPLNIDIINELQTSYISDTTQKSTQFSKRKKRQALSSSEVIIIYLQFFEDRQIYLI